MPVIEESVFIKQPVDVVFTYVTAIENLTKWELNILEAEQTSPGEMGIGTTCRGVIRSMVMRMEWTSETTEYEPHKRCDKAISYGSMRIRERLTFNTVDEGTEFTMMYDMKAGWPLKLLTPLLMITMSRQMKKNLVNLKNILEARA